MKSEQAPKTPEVKPRGYPRLIMGQDFRVKNREWRANLMRGIDPTAEPQFCVLDLIYQGPLALITSRHSSPGPEKGRDRSFLVHYALLDRNGKPLAHVNTRDEGHITIFNYSFSPQDVAEALEAVQDALKAGDAHKLYCYRVI